MKLLMKVNCGPARFEFDICGTNLVKYIEQNNSQDGILYLLDSADEYLDAVFIVEDIKDVSYRVLFFQLKPVPDPKVQDFKEKRDLLLNKLLEIHTKHAYLADLLTDFAKCSFDQKCILVISGILLRSGEIIEPLSDEDRKAAGLTGIPLEMLDDSEENQQSEFLARIYSGGMPPPMLIKQEGVTFPTRAWFPAGLMPDWHPWKQNVEFQTTDRLVIHTEFHGSKTDLKDLHQTIINNDVRDQTDVSLITIRASL